MYCPNCGAKVNEGSDVCISCGKFLNRNVSSNTTTATTEGSTIGWGILGFFIPLAGLILFFVWNNTKPRSAKSAGIGALISTCISIFLTIFIYIIIFAYTMAL